MGTSDLTLQGGSSVTPDSSAAAGQADAAAIDQNKQNLQAWQTAEHEVADNQKATDAVIGYAA
jgi:hypothetical protein